MQDKNPGEKNPTDWHHLRGRLYRIAPPGAKYATPKLDLQTVAGQIAALHSPNMATRYLAWTKLNEGSAEQTKALQEMWTKDQDPRMRARALWLLARGKEGQAAIQAGLKDKNEDLRITAFRAARLIKMDIPALSQSLLGDESMGLLREIALAMNYEPAEKAVPILVKLAEKYDGKDRWYLEALGIGATGKEDLFLAAWEKDHKASPITEKLIWRMKKIDPTVKATAGARADATEEGRRPF